MPCLNCSNRRQDDLSSRERAIRRAGKEDPVYTFAPTITDHRTRQTKIWTPPGFLPPRICQACGVVYFPPEPEEEQPKREFPDANVVAVPPHRINFCIPDHRWPCPDCGGARAHFLHCTRHR